MTEINLKEFNKEQDVLVKASGGLRGKPHRLLKDATVYAIAGFGSRSPGDQYEHPYLTMCAQRTWGAADVYSDNLLSIEFQRTRHDRRGDWESAEDFEDRKKRPSMHGFMARYRGRWGQCYAGRVEHYLDRREQLQVGLGLIDRAHAYLNDWDSPGRKLRNIIEKKANGCQLLMLITGLAHIGIPTIVRNGRACKLPAEYTLVA